MSSPRYSQRYQSVNDFYRRFEAKEPEGLPKLRPDMRVVKNAFPYAAWMDAVIHFGKNKGLRLGELRMCQAWWYLEKFNPKPYGAALAPSDEDYALRFALNGMLRAIASCPKEQISREAARARSGYPTARDILKQRGLPLPEQAELTNHNHTNKHTS